MARRLLGSIRAAGRTRHVQPLTPTAADKLQRFLPWIAGGVLLLGVVTFLQVMNRPEDDSAEGARTTRTESVPRTVVPPREARNVIARFIQTAVARKDLDEAWKISGPKIRGGLTRKQWMSGEIPVIPFDVDPKAEGPAKLEWSYENEVSYQVLLLPRPGSEEKSTLFYVNAEKFGEGRNARWLVNYWGSTPGPGARETFTN